MLLLTLLGLAGLLPALPLTAQRKIPEGIPLNGRLPMPLDQTYDASLQQRLEAEVDLHTDWLSLVQRKKMAVGLVDIGHMNRIRFARLNGNEMMYAASLPKIAILLAAMDALEKKELEETPEIRKDLRLMISRSDNQASTRMIDRLGYEKIEAVLTSERYHLYDKAMGGGLWVGKRYASEGRRYPDPLRGLSHAATVTQVCRFYYMLVFGELVSPARSRQMLQIMADPDLHHKFVSTLDRSAPAARVFRKSGTWKDYHADSVLVWGPRRKYILVGLVQDSRGEQILRGLVRSAEKAMGF